VELPLRRGVRFEELGALSHFPDVKALRLVHLGFFEVRRQPQLLLVVHLVLN
jgi:hypothetical protein